MATLNDGAKGSDYDITPQSVTISASKASNSVIIAVHAEGATPAEIQAAIDAASLYIPKDEVAGLIHNMQAALAWLVAE